MFSALGCLLLQYLGGDPVHPIEAVLADRDLAGDHLNDRLLLAQLVSLAP